MYGSYYSYSDTRALQEYLSKFLIVYIALIVFYLVVMWRVFTKAGEKGWKCLIPIYNAYILWKIGWETSKFWILLAGSFVVGIFNALIMQAGQAGAIIGGLIGLAWGIYTIYLAIKMAIVMAHRFGKSTAFGVLGLAFFSIIGYPILAFGSADYDFSRDRG